jgi:hypothetical protein
VPFAQVILLKLFMKSHNNPIAQTATTPVPSETLENISLFEDTVLKEEKKGWRVGVSSFPQIPLRFRSPG